MKLLFLLLLCSVAVAQIQQLSGTSGSVAGFASSATHRSTAVTGQPIVGEASGGEFGTRSGIAEIFEQVVDALDAHSGPAEVPTEFSFAQNFPNPFNPSTTFEFTLPKASPATLIIYDQLGRVAARLFERELPVGKYTTHFEAPVAWGSGLYFAVFETPEFKQVRKIVLLK